MFVEDPFAQGIPRVVASFRVIASRWGLIRMVETAEIARILVEFWLWFWFRAGF
jgi:hypothetical protein